MKIITVCGSLKYIKEMMDILVKVHYLKLNLQNL